MAEEEKEQAESGVTVKDRRRFTPEGEVREDAPEKETSSPSTGAEEKESPLIDPPPSRRGAETRQSPPPPPMDFSTFVMSLYQTTLIHLGEIHLPDDPEEIEPNLPMAKQTIDILEMLKEKTEGNLNHQEEQLLRKMLFELQMLYVNTCKATGGTNCEEKR